MSLIDRRGLKIVKVPARRATVDEAEKSRDIAIVRMHRDGQSWRAIGKFLRISHEGARKRWLSLREDVRAHYGSRSLA